MKSWRPSKKGRSQADSSSLTKKKKYQENITVTTLVKRYGDNTRSKLLDGTESIFGYL